MISALVGLAGACSDAQDDTERPPMTEPAPSAPSSSAPSGATPPATGTDPSGAATPQSETGAQPQSGAGTAETTDFSGGTAEAGKEVYGMYCQTCHGETGTGDGPGAAALDPKPRDFTTGEFAFDPNGNGQKGEAEDIARVVRDGAATYGGSPNMVPWGPALSEQQLKDVVAYVQSLAGGGAAEGGQAPS